MTESFKERTHAPILVECFECRHVLGTQLKIENIEILLNSRLCYRLGDRHCTALHQVTQNDLAGALVVLLPDLRDGPVVQEAVDLAETPVTLGGAEGAVGHDAHPELLAQFEQGLLGEVRVALHLVHHRLDLAVVHESPELRRVEVGHADGADQALAHQLLHGAPRVQDVHGAEQHLAVGALGGEVVTVLESRGPVHQVQVDVVQAQVRQRLAAGPLHRVRVVRVVPELGADVDVLALDDALRDLGPHRGAHLLLVLVEQRAVDVPVADVEGVHHRLLHLADVLQGKFHKQT